MTQTKAELLQTRHQGDIRLGDADSTNYVGFKAPATVGSNLVWTLPATDGSANQFLQTNASGVLGWGTADVSSAMPLSGGTFTGTVNFGDNVKARWGTGNDLEVYHNGGDNFIKNAVAGTSLRISKSDDSFSAVFYDTSVALYYSGTKKFETTSAGIAITGAATVSTDLTVTGDLTVSGTTTTINTTTLEVEDKNIEMGKVSTPSDTTADGGGITLKGATDKTINWVNSTDAWTFSEHINIASGKKLGVGGANYGTSGQVLTSGGSSTHPSWTTISSAPEISGTASGSIAQDKACIVKTDGNLTEVAKSVTQQAPAFADTQTYNTSNHLDWGGGTLIWIESIGCYFAGWWDRDSSNNNYYRAKIGIPGSGKDINWCSTTNNIANSNQQTPIAMGYDTSSGWVVYMNTNNSGNSTQRIRAVKPVPDFDSVNNSTLTTAGSSGWLDIANNAFEPKGVVYDATAGKLVVFIDSYARVLSVNSSDGALSWASGSSATDLSGGTLRGAKYFSGMGRIGVLTNRNSQSLYFRTLTVNSDNTITANAEVQLEDGANNSPNGQPSNVISYDWTWDDSISRIVVTYVIHDGTDFGKTSFRVGNLAANGTVTWTNRATLIDYSGSGNAALYSSSSHALLYEPNVGRLCLAFTDPGDSSKMKALKWNATTAGATANVGTETELKSDGNPNILIYKADKKCLIVNFKTPSSPRGEGNSGSITLGTATTNMTTENFVGFAKAAATNGNSVDIKVTGNTSTQSSLTAGQKYYVQMDGTLGTSADTPSVEAGLALSSTKLLIKPA